MSSIKFKLVTNANRYQQNIDKITNEIVNGNVKIDGPQIDQIDKIIKIKLKDHQKRMVYEMLQKEHEESRTSSGINLNVLADKVGSGKSIDILSLIALEPIVKVVPNNKAKYSYPRDYYTGITGLRFNEGKCVFFKTNILVVPHSIYHQWLGYLKDFPTINCYEIKTKKDVTGIEKIVDDLREGKYQLILVKSTRYNDMMKAFAGISEYITSCKSKQIDNNVGGGNKPESKSEPVYQKLKDVKNYLRDNANFMDKIDDDFNSIKNNMFDNLIKHIEYLKDLNTKQLKNEIRDLLIREYIEIESGCIFERVIFDEIDSIKIPNSAQCYSKRMWGVTSSINNLIYPKGYKKYWKSDYAQKKNIVGFRNNGFLKKTFINNDYLEMDIIYANYFQEIFLKNNDKFVENSFQLVEPLIRFYECLTPRHLSILEDIALPSIIEALNAGNLKGAIEMTNCKKASENNITKCILINVDTQIEKIDKDIATKSKKLNEVTVSIKKYAKYVKKLTDEMSDLKDQLTIQSIQLINSDEYDDLENDLNGNKDILGQFRGQKQNLVQSLKTHNINLKNLTNKRNLIKERISNTSEKDCPICFQFVTKPMITPCCKNVFCFECLATSLSYTSSCPFCRAKIKFNDCCLIDDNKEDSEANVEIPDMPIPKLKKLMQLLEEKKDKRILLFSGFDNTFKTLEREFEKNDFKYEYLKGNTGHIKNIIEQYNENKFNILILNAKFFGSGLNLQMTDDIIIYHRMDKDLEKQIIGRGQRLGRMSRLNIHYLCYNTELPTK